MENLNVISRRGAVIGGIGLAVGSIAACSTTNSNNAADPGKKSTPPTYVPYESAKPDLPGDDTGGVPAGYYHYPAEPPTFAQGPIGTGDEISALLQGSRVAVPQEKNGWWQHLEKEMNVKLKLNSLVSADYGNKFKVNLAGGDFPDLTQIVEVPDMPQVLDKYFVNLSDYLSGDNVKKYPGLAALPPSAWTAGMVNGRLYGVAQPRSSAGRALTARVDILQQLGLSTEIADGKAFLDLCRALTDAKSNRWAFGASPTDWLVPGVLEMMGGPNKWSVKDGKFIRDIESDEFSEALEVVRTMWSEGLVHPDSYAQKAANGSWWLGGTTVFLYQAFEGWSNLQKANPKVKIGAVVAPRWDGGGAAVKHLGTGNYASYVAIKKMEDKRVEEILRVLNYLASPFGTAQYLTINYGVKGQNYNLNGSDPVVTDTGRTEKIISLGYVGGTGYTVLYESGQTDLVKAQHDYLTAAIASGVRDATVGLYSKTDSTMGVTENTKLTSLQNDIIQGRKPVSDFATAVDNWKRAAGDRIRGEYEEAYRESR